MQGLVQMAVARNESMEEATPETEPAT